jgi:transcriptional regulator with XRE-family HTH domain
MKEDREALGQRLRAARKAAHLTQRDVEACTRIDQGTISRMEKGSRDVTALELRTLARLYGTDANALLGLPLGLDTLGSVPSEVRRIRPLNENGYHGTDVQVGRVY